MKKLTIALLLVLVLTVVPTLAAQNDGLRVEYDGFGRVEVDFKKNVRYNEPGVSVQNAKGESLPAVVLDLDDDDLDFVVENLVPGESYTFTITGVSYAKTETAEPFTGSFRVPAEGEIAVRKIDYDRDDRELEVDFNTKVEYEQLNVSVQDADGKTYDVEIREKDRDSVEMRVSGLERGVEYSVIVSGLRLSDSANTVSVTGTFTA